MSMASVMMLPFSFLILFILVMFLLLLSTFKIFFLSLYFLTIQCNNNNIERMLLSFKGETCMDYFGFRFLDCVYTWGNAMSV